MGTETNYTAPKQHEHRKRAMLNRVAPKLLVLANRLIEYDKHAAGVIPSPIVHEAKEAVRTYEESSK